MSREDNQGFFHEYHAKDRAHGGKTATSVTTCTQPKALARRLARVAAVVEAFPIFARRDRLFAAAEFHVAPVAAPGWPARRETDARG